MRAYRLYIKLLKQFKIKTLYMFIISILPYSQKLLCVKCDSYPLNIHLKLILSD